MVELPETRESLLLKIRDAADTAAWEQFVTMYRPALYRLARRFGLQDADAEDLAQDVLVSVSNAIVHWRKEASRGTFRAWLLTIARNACLNALSRRRPDASRGGTSVLERLEQFPADSEVEPLIDDEHRRAVFRWAANEIRPEFHEGTWQAFWLTTIEDFSMERAASELGKSVGSVYAARSRVMRRLKTKVCEFQ